MRKELDELHSLFTQITKKEGDIAAAAHRGLEVVAALQQHDDVRPSVKVTRRGADVEYVVEKAANGETLAERRRTGVAKPYRCPKAIYNALVEVLSSVDRALPLDDLVAAVGRVLGDDPPDFQVRVPLRLWMQVEPPLIVRNRARYRPVDAKAFAVTANDLWCTLRN